MERLSAWALGPGRALAGRRRGAPASADLQHTGPRRARDAGRAARLAAQRAACRRGPPRGPPRPPGWSTTGPRDSRRARPFVADPRTAPRGVQVDFDAAVDAARVASALRPTVCWTWLPAASSDATSFCASPPSRPFPEDVRALLRCIDWAMRANWPERAAGAAASSSCRVQPGVGAPEAGGDVGAARTTPDERAHETRRRSPRSPCPSVLRTCPSAAPTTGAPIGVPPI
ncbi:hypothetical protein QJS66_09095 [Kocuria rhizophila]|nr:hypothetical protein QJS66_09095 [Kocuria rhizophila]